MAAPGAASARQNLVQLLNRRIYSSHKVIRENDVVFVRDVVSGRKSRPLHRSRLTKPLTRSSDINLSRGARLRGSELIGRCISDSVPVPFSAPVTLHEASLAAYVVHQSRPCTPIYPQDASLIVSLLDLNLPVPGEDADFDAGPPFEIFEAGTGAGSLTLHLARAIHGANPPVPAFLRDPLCAAPYLSRAEVLSLPDETRAADPHPLRLPRRSLREDTVEYLRRRRAVVHTLDVEPAHSRAAHGVVRGFRRAQYLLDVDFHVGSITQHLRGRLAHTGGEPFLAHAVLDLPSPLADAAAVVDALRPDGLLVVFQPSVTQVAGVVRWARETAQPVRLELAIEMPQAADKGRDLLDGTGGRQWDIRVVREGEGTASSGGRLLPVCRPKAGGVVGGGGFVAVFRRMKLPPSPPGRPDGSDADEGHDGGAVVDP